MRAYLCARTFKQYLLDGLSAIVAILVVFLAGGFNASSGPLMAGNTLLTIAMITREALRVLENNLTFTKQVNRQLTVV